VGPITTFAVVIGALLVLVEVAQRVVALLASVKALRDGHVLTHAESGPMRTVVDFSPEPCTSCRTNRSRRHRPRDVAEKRQRIGSAVGNALKRLSRLLRAR
jgi:hypothetical protein